MGKRDENTPPSTNPLPDPGVPALTVQELEVTVRELLFPLPGPGALPWTLQRERIRVQSREEKRWNTSQAQTAHARGARLSSARQAPHCQTGLPRSSNKIASSCSAMSRSRSRRLISGRSGSPCRKRKNKEGGGTHSISEKEWIQENESERHATGPGQGSPVGAQGPEGQRGEMEAEK